MGVLNPSFEDPGVLPGEAEHWTLVAVTSREVIAGFGADPQLAWEGFERWSALWRALEDVVVARAFFDPAAEGFEDFEEAWDNDLYLFEMSPGLLLAAIFGPSAVEDCETGWDNDPFATSWVDVAHAPGVFDGELAEDFEEQWRSNEAFAWGWADVTSTVARFDADTQDLEDFDNDWDLATTL